MAVALAYAVCAIVWGTTWFAIRVCIQEGGYPTLPSAALRFSIAAVLLFAILALGFGRPLPRGARQWRGLIAAGVANALSYGLVYTGEESVSGGIAAVLFATTPLITALLAALSKTERIGWHHLAGALVALLGTAVLFSDRMSVSPEQSAGVAIVLGGVLASAIYSLILKREAGPVHALSSAAVFLGVTAVTLWIVAAIRGPVSLPWPPPAAPTVALLYLAIFGSVFTFASYLYLLQRVTLMATTTLLFIQPLIALAVDAAWEREIRLGPKSYAGVAIILCGVFITVALRRRSR